MKHGKDVRDSSGQPLENKSANEIPVLMFVMVEQALGAFRLRCVSNDEVIADIRAQEQLEGFLKNVDELYAEFRARFTDLELDKPSRLN